MRIYRVQLTLIRNRFLYPFKYISLYKGYLIFHISELFLKIGSNKFFLRSLP